MLVTLALQRLFAPSVLLLACATLHAQTAPLPDAPSSPGLIQRSAYGPSGKPAPRPVIINGRPYQRPTQHQLFVDYLNDSYGLPSLARSTVRSLYNFSLDQPKGWDQDATGFAQRFGSNLGINAINGNVRYGMEEVFHEDLRYIPCHGCNFKHKIENALLAEITARHDSDGHRFFTLTPTVADFSGPIIARELWYPAGGKGAIGGVIATRTVFATRIGSHLFREFVLERRHHDRKEREAGPATPSVDPPSAARSAASPPPAPQLVEAGRNPQGTT